MVASPTTDLHASSAGQALSRWEPEDPEFWRTTGRLIAWTTLILTTFNLFLAFATWFMVSALVVRLRGVGFQFSNVELFWLTAMPGLAGGTLRMVHTFLIPILGTRTTVTGSTLLLVLPCIGWGLAVQSSATPYWVLLLLAFLSGLGGGNFSSFMPSTSLFFPKRLQGTALGIQAGVGNFGVSVAQFLIPWIVGIALCGSLLGSSQAYTKGSTVSEVWLQNAAYVWIPLILVGTLLGAIWLRSVPVHASLREQSDIFRNKHTWLMTSLYLMTFGSFSGFAAVFPLLIAGLFGRFEGAPDPLTYAFLGPLVGAASRVLFGPISDRCGGAIVTMISGLGLLGCALWVAGQCEPTSLEHFPGFLWGMLGLFLFSGIGNASTFKQMPMIFPPRQAGGVIGWTSAVAAYGPFLFAAAIAGIIAQFGNPRWFFYGVAAFYVVNCGINWWYYLRPGAEKPC